MHQLGPIKATMLQIGEVVQGNAKNLIKETKSWFKKVECLRY